MDISTDGAPPHPSKHSPCPPRYLPTRAAPTLAVGRYTDNFEGYEPEQTVKYLTDQAGSFNAAAAPGNLGATSRGAAGAMVLKQVVTQPPIPGHWWGNSQPYALAGNSQNWTDITVSVKVST